MIRIAPPNVSRAVIFLGLRAEAEFCAGSSSSSSSSLSSVEFSSSSVSSLFSDFGVDFLVGEGLENAVRPNTTMMGIMTSQTVVNVKHH